MLAGCSAKTGLKPSLQWCLLAAPLILGSDIRSLSPIALATLSNTKAM